VRSGMSAAVPVFHLTAHTATLVQSLFYSSVLFLFLSFKLEELEVVSSVLSHLSVED
jgi:hypothetical protein